MTAPSSSVIETHLSNRRGWIVDHAPHITIKDVKRLLEKDLELQHGQLDVGPAADIIEQCVDAILVDAIPQILAARVR